MLNRVIKSAGSGNWPMEPRSPEVVRFGIFEVDLRSRELRKRGIRIKLHEQPLQVLTLLLERPGQVVTREELKGKLWAVGTVVDFDHGLDTAINKLREALGDSADSPRFVETLPRRGYRLICPVDSRAVEVGGPALSLAVLPLKNLSGDPGQDYFADGTTEALITELGKIGSLRVLSYQSVIQYRQTAKPLPQITRELNVGAVLEGSVLRSENRVRITANLLQPAPERHLWAESFEFDPRDVLAVQREVAREVARQTQVTLTPQERARLTTSQRVDPEAHEAYLLGRAYFYKVRTATNSMRAKEYFEKAIAKDSGHAAAYASMAELYIWTGGAGTLMTDPKAGYREARIRARQWAERALAVDDTLAEAHNALAMVKQLEWDWVGAERDYRRAIELNPNYAVARISYAFHIYALQRFDEAAAQAERAQQLDPASPFVNTWAAATYFLAGRVEDAMASLQRVLELEPSYADASIVFTRVYVSRGMHQEAIAELQRALTFNAREPFVLGALAHVYGRAGQTKAALKLVGELKRMEAERGKEMPTFPFVWAYAGLDDKDQAFAWLEKSYQERRQRLVWLGVDPLVDPLRSDARFHDLMRRMGLPIKSPPRPR